MAVLCRASSYFYYPALAHRDGLLQHGHGGTYQRDGPRRRGRGRQSVHAVLRRGSRHHLGAHAGHRAVLRRGKGAGHPLYGEAGILLDVRFGARVPGVRLDCRAARAAGTRPGAACRVHHGALSHGRLVRHHPDFPRGCSAQLHRCAWLYAPHDAHHDDDGTREYRTELHLHVWQARPAGVRRHRRGHRLRARVHAEPCAQCGRRAHDASVPRLPHLP